MEKLYINEILSAVNGKLLCGADSAVISSVSINSKEVKKGSLFIPIKGENFDAHNFIEDAFNAGAIATLTSNHDKMDSDNIYIKVKDTKKALQDLAAYYRRKFNIPVIGITGSVGKTSTKEMISAALSSKFNVLKTSGNLNGQIGLPLTIFNLESQHDVAVLEMGISEPCEMDRLSYIAKPDYAVMTNIGVTHIENLHTKENILKEKFKITKTLNKDSVLFINGDDELLSNIENNYEYKVVSFGIKNDCTFKATNIFQNDETTEFDVIYENIKERIIIPTIGEHNVYNAMVAIAIGVCLGINIYDLKKGLLKFENLNMRQCIYHLNEVTLIDDSYNANPDSMRSAVKVLIQVAKGKRKIAVLADMLELGNMSKSLHYDLGTFIAQMNVDILITIGEMADYIAKGAISCSKNINVYSFDSNEQAINCLKNIVCLGDTILVKGSRGMHTEKISHSIIFACKN